MASESVLKSPNIKELGAYYTPPGIVRSLVHWATTASATAHVLDPSCGDGRFLQGIANACGVEVDPVAAGLARSRLNSASIYNEDFFSWAARVELCFDAAIGNPPFIRYQRFNGETRTRALRLCQSQGVQLTALSSSWAPFVVGAASLLRNEGRIGFVVPAEIGHAVYARPLIRWLLRSFGRVEVIAIREKLFPELSEDCWLLRASGYGRSTKTLHFVRLNQFDPEESLWHYEPITESELDSCDFRLRPLLLPSDVRTTYRNLAQDCATKRLGSIAKLGIGYVTGANDFFHLRPTQAKELSIPDEFLRVALRSNRDLAEVAVIDQAVVDRWIADDRAVLLLDLAGRTRLPPAVQAYLRSPAGEEACRSYKCRNRSPWYAVPDVRPPHAFLSIMSGRGPGWSRIWRA